MNAKHLVTNFVSPALFYMSIVLYFMAALSLMAASIKDPGFLILGLITFILGYNSWYFAKRAKEET